MLCGGARPAEDADAEIQQFIDSLTEHIHTHVGRSFPHLKALKVRKQVVNGTNYYVKVDAGNEHIHVKFHKALPVYGDGLTLSDVQLGHSSDSPLESF